METVTQKIFHYYQSKELITEEIRTLVDEMEDGIGKDGEIIEVFNYYLLNIVTKSNTNGSIAGNSFTLNSVHVQSGLFSLPISV